MGLCIVQKVMFANKAVLAVVPTTGKGGQLAMLDECTDAAPPWQHGACNAQCQHAACGMVHSRCPTLLQRVPQQPCRCVLARFTTEAMPFNPPHPQPHATSEPVSRDAVHIVMSAPQWCWYDAYVLACIQSCKQANWPWPSLLPHIRWWCLLPAGLEHKTRLHGPSVTAVNKRSSYTTTRCKVAMPDAAAWLCHHSLLSPVRGAIQALCISSHAASCEQIRGRSAPPPEAPARSSRPRCQACLGTILALP